MDWCQDLLNLMCLFNCLLSVCLFEVDRINWLPGKVEKKKNLQCQLQGWDHLDLSGLMLVPRSLCYIATIPFATITLPHHMAPHSLCYDYIPLSTINVIFAIIFHSHNHRTPLLWLHSTFKHNAKCLLGATMSKYWWDPPFSSMRASFDAGMVFMYWASWC